MRISPTRASAVADGPARRAVSRASRKDGDQCDQLTKVAQIINTTASIPTKFCATPKTTKCSSWVVQIRAQKSKMMDGRHFEKKTLNHHIYATVFWLIFDEIWQGDEYWSPTTGDRPLKFRIFENSRWRWPPSWKSQQSRYLSNGLVDQSRPLQSIVNVFRPKKVTSSYYTKRPTLSNTNPTVDVPLQFFLSPELEKKSTV